MRGERRHWRSSTTISAGSSPLARGTGQRREVDLLRSRFIPACAGNGRAGGVRANPRAVHPRLRGERGDRFILVVRFHGSSPLARGTVGRRGCNGIPRRFIPACAGNGTWPIRGRPSPPVHPRLRGERVQGAQEALAAFGSSPLARGTALPVVAEVRMVRFIPACAGNGGLPPPGRSPRPVHPRLRGERTNAICCCAFRYGSSPLARGTVPVEAVDGK